MRRSSSGGTTSGGCGCLVAILLANLILGGVTTSYVAESFTGVKPPFVVAAVAGLFLGEFTIPGAVLCWLIRSCGVPAPFMKPATAPAAPSAAPPAPVAAPAAP